MAERVALTRSFGYVASVIMFVTTCAWAAPPENLAEASTTKAAREAALGEIPFAQMPRDVAANVQKVVNATSIYRRLPQQSFDCEPDLYLDLIQNPEIVVNMWSTLGMTKMSMDRIGPGQYQITDGNGTKGTIKLVYGDDVTHVVLSEGSYTGAMFPRAVHGKCVLLLRSNYQQDQRGRMLVSCTLDMFLAIENMGVEVLAKTFASTIGKTADHNFGEVTGFVSKLSKSSENNPAGVIKLVNRIEKVEPAVKQEFNTIVQQVEPKLARAKVAYEERMLAATQQTGQNQTVPLAQPSPVQPVMSNANQNVVRKKPLPAQPAAQPVPNRTVTGQPVPTYRPQTTIPMMRR